MSTKRKTNRDHAKKSQRPMVEDEVIAAELEALVKPAIIAQKALKTEEHVVTRERILIILLRNEGKTYDEISRFLGCCKRQAWYWCNHANPKDIESFRDKRKKVNNRKVTEEYIEKLTEIIIKEPEEFSYEFGRWTVARLATDIKKTAYC